MTGITFESDERKAAGNRKKHGIRFEEATSVFPDENARLIHDPMASADEDRFVLLGLSNQIDFLLSCTAIEKMTR